MTVRIRSLTVLIPIAALLVVSTSSTEHECCDRNQSGERMDSDGHWDSSLLLISVAPDTYRKR